MRKECQQNELLKFAKRFLSRWLCVRLQLGFLTYLSMCVCVCDEGAVWCSSKILLSERQKETKNVIFHYSQSCLSVRLDIALKIQNVILHVIEYLS